MKTTIVYTTLLLTAATLFSCKKQYSVENENGLPADIMAQINGVTWEAADSTQSASFGQGGISIVGTASDGSQLTIVLNDTLIGTYVLNQTSTSGAAFGNLDSASIYYYTTTAGSDTSQAGGTVNILTINKVGKTISGIFSFKVYRPLDSTQKVFTSGVFYNIPYVE